LALSVVLAAGGWAAPRASAGAKTAEPAAPPEYQVRAELILVMVKYVAWPPAEGKDGDLVLGVVGRDPFGQVLTAMEGQSVLGRRIVIRRFRTHSDYRPCHLLYFPAGEEWQLANWRRRNTGAGVLTVGESERFLDLGGAIQIFNLGKNIRFTVNTRALNRASLAMEPKALLNAHKVTTQP
jgi:hypothetical protein